ncbi:MAG TPA: hypothetical protein VMF59_00125 [Bacteroidota bacterium]|nr:hypothetical protein [Bacteroidota bacterium]
MMKDFTVYYNFRLPDGSEEGFHLRLDPETLELRGNTPEVSPEWTKLDFHQCPNCPLNVEDHPHCPLALRLVNLVQRFDGLLSHEKVDMEVVTEERTITQQTTAQRGISSLMGLVIAASGCPHTALLRPMARFHLPFASNEETVYRATSMYLLAQYFLKKEGASADLELDGLARIYGNMQIINVAVAERLRAATTTDSSVNAIVVLDVYAKTVEMVIEGSLERIRYLFAPYFQKPSSDS